MIIRKSPEEIDAMAAAGDVVVRTLRVLERMVRAGVTTAELDDAAEKYIRSQGGVVELGGAHPGSHHPLEDAQGAHDDVARRGHRVDLLGALADDHASSSRRSVTSVERMCPWTSSGESVPSKRWSRPRSS